MSVARELFILYSFLLIHFLHAAEVGEAQWLPAPPPAPASPPPPMLYLVSCIFFSQATETVVVLCKHLGVPRCPVESERFPGMGMGTYGARVCLSERAAKWALGFGY